jgi:hypothetical protein
VALAVAGVEQRGAVPTARDIAKAASEMGVPYTLVTGVPLPDQFVDNVLATPQAVLANEKFERFDAVFSGPGTRCRPRSPPWSRAAPTSRPPASESLAYLDRCLDGGFRPAWATSCPTGCSGPSPTPRSRRRGRREHGPSPSTFPPMTPSTDKNQQLFDRARALIPGGVNSPCARSAPSAARRASCSARKGAYFWDANGARYIDYIGSWGPDDPGPRPPRVLEAVQKAVLEGFSFGAPTEREIEWPRRS